MTTTHFADASRVASGRARISTFNALYEAAGTVMRNLFRRRAISRLNDLDDRLLDDIGLTRFDVRSARAIPFWEDPTLDLAKRAIRRRYRRLV